MSHQISRSVSLHSIPEKKLLYALEEIISKCEVCSINPNAKIDRNICKICRLHHERLRRYADANIPTLYWNLEMERDFVGDEILKEKYLDIVKNLKQTYNNGTSLCFAGHFGTGKSFTTTNILKRAVEKNFSSLYINLNDIVSVMLNRDSEDRSQARRELLMVDFLVIDEFDPRYMANDKASDLFGKILEEIFRTRSQNKLPTFMCTNSPNVVESFVGSIKQSIESLMSTVEIIPVLGKDQRILKGYK